MTIEYLVEIPSWGPECIYSSFKTAEEAIQKATELHEEDRNEVEVVKRIYLTVGDYEVTLRKVIKRFNKKEN